MCRQNYQPGVESSQEHCPVHFTLFTLADYLSVVNGAGSGTRTHVVVVSGWKPDAFATKTIPAYPFKVRADLISIATKM